jgi:TDG/mug DNA glycosylase family protein
VEPTRPLPDRIGPGLRLLMCGLNPSLHAVEAGLGYVTAGNRFWPAMLEAGLVTRDRDAEHALAVHRIGMTDLVARATPRAAEIGRDEFRAGLAELEAKCERYQPGAICFVGLVGWRAAVDRKAVAGVQDRRVGGRPAYVMPSTSGLNAATPLAVLVDHLRAAAALADSAAGRT